MKGRYTLILFLLNLIVAGVILYLHVIKNASLSEDGHQSSLFEINLTEVDFLQIAGEELDSSRIFVKQGGEWLITSPVEWKANLHAINRLLNQLRWLEQRGGFPLQDTLSYGQSLADFGLETPRLIVTVGRGNERETLQIGRSTSVGDRIYALNPKRDYIHVLSRRIVETLLMQVEDLRSHDVFDIPAFETTSVRIQTPQEDNRYTTTTLIREGKSWNFETPIRTRASSELVEEMLNRLTQTKAIRFLNVSPERLLDYGLGNTTLNVRLEGNNRSEQLLIGNKVDEDSAIPQVYARLNRFPNTVFTIAARQTQYLQEPQTRLREKRILDFRGRPPNELTIREGDLLVNLKKQENDQWQYLKESDNGEFRPEKAERELVEFIIDFLNRIEVIEFVLDAPTQEDLERFGLLQPRMEISMTDPGESTLLIGGNADGDTLYVQKKGEPFVYRISGEILEWITPNPLFYRDRTLQKLPSGAQIQSVVLRASKSEDPWFSWDLNSGNTTENTVEKPPLQELVLNKIRDFRVEEYIEDTYWESLKDAEGNTVPWTLHLNITWSLRGGDSSQVTRDFYFSKPIKAGTQIGTSPELKMTFYLTQDWVELLESLQQEYKPAQPEMGPPPGESPRDPLVDESAKQESVPAEG